VALLRIPVFRRVWAAIMLSSLGDWLGLLATTAMAQQLTADESVAVQGTAISGVILIRLLPDLVLGAFAGALADRLDRRTTVIVGELLAASLYLSIAIGYDLLWLYLAQFLIEAVGLFTMPAKQALWVNIVPRKRLAVANQLSLLSVYGAVPVAALLFALLNTASRFFADPSNVDPELAQALDDPSVPIIIALGFNAVSFLISAGTIFFSRNVIPAYTGPREKGASLLVLIKEGVSFLRSNALMKALYVGILGAFAAGGFVIGVAQLWVITLSAGTAGYSILFGTVFSGLALGMLLGPRLLPGITRRRIFSVSIGLAGVVLVVMSFMREFVLAAALAGAVGFFSGVSWIVGYTLGTDHPLAHRRHRAARGRIPGHSRHHDRADPAGLQRTGSDAPHRRRPCRRGQLLRLQPGGPGAAQCPHGSGAQTVRHGPAGPGRTPRERTAHSRGGPRLRRAPSGRRRCGRLARHARPRRRADRQRR
jgi:dTMP kinase